MGHHQTEGTAKRICYQLYVILDDFSRYLVGCMVAKRESAELATRLIEQTIAKQRNDRDQLTIHSDYDRADEIVVTRTTALALAHQRHHERFVQGSPVQQTTTRISPDLLADQHAAARGSSSMNSDVL